MNLLSIDWDYFFPEPEHDRMTLFDWGHQESRLFIEQLWEIRAAGFIHRQMPLPALSGQELGFWEQFQFSQSAKLWLSESHAFACEERLASLVKRKKPVIWSFDQHHDLGYGEGALARIKKGEIQCGDWLLAYSLWMNPYIHIRYPHWKTWAFEDEFDYALDIDDHLKSIMHVDRQIIDDKNMDDLPVFDAVFICRSGAWVPSWLDDDFFAFVDACPLAGHRETLGHFPLHKRTFSLVMANEYADQTSKLMKQHQEKVKGTTR